MSSPHAKDGDNIPTSDGLAEYPCSEMPSSVYLVETYQTGFTGFTGLSGCGGFD
jgi:hypothetical protein